MIMTTSTVCIRDKNGKYWNTTCSTEYIDHEICNMQQHLDAAAKYPERYRFLDLASAAILVNGTPHHVASDNTIDMPDEELLKALGL